MTVWLDAHLSPAIARWLSETFDVTALPVRELGLRGAEDDQIFFSASRAVVLRRPTMAANIERISLRLAFHLRQAYGGQDG